MDWGETYIEMCRKATEIQAMLSAYEGSCPVIVYPSIGERVWLPGQDELQAMVALDWARRQVEFYDFIFSKANSLCPDCINAVQPSNFVDGEPVFETLVNNVGLAWKTPEQAWLSFVMYNLYGKTWDGKEWVEA